MNLRAAQHESPFFRLSLDLMIHLKSLRFFCIYCYIMIVIRKF